jgi:hypothetical protein
MQLSSLIKAQLAEKKTDCRCGYGNDSDSSACAALCTERWSVKDLPYFTAVLSQGQPDYGPAGARHESLLAENCRVTREIQIDACQAADDGPVMFLPYIVNAHKAYPCQCPPGQCATPDAHKGRGHFGSFIFQTNGKLRKLDTAPVDHRILSASEETLEYTRLPDGWTPVSVGYVAPGETGLMRAHPYMGLPSPQEVARCAWCPLTALELATTTLFRHTGSDSDAALYDLAPGEGCNVHLYKPPPAASRDNTDHDIRPPFVLPAAAFAAGIDADQPTSLVIGNMWADAKIAGDTSAKARANVDLAQASEVERVHLDASLKSGTGLTQALQIAMYDVLLAEAKSCDPVDAERVRSLENSFQMGTHLNTNSLSPEAYRRIHNKVLRTERANIATTIVRPVCPETAEYRLLLIGDRDCFANFEKEPGILELGAMKDRMFPKMISAHYTSPPRINGVNARAGLKACYVCFATSEEMSFAKYSLRARTAERSLLATGTHPTCSSGTEGITVCSVDTGGGKRGSAQATPTYLLVDKVVVRGFPFTEDSDKPDNLDLTRLAFRRHLGSSVRVPALDLFVEDRIDVFRRKRADKTCTVFVRTFGPRNVNLLVDTLNESAATAGGKCYELSASGSSPGTTVCVHCRLRGHREDECPIVAVVVRSFTRMNKTTMDLLARKTKATRFHLGSKPGFDNPKILRCLALRRQQCPQLGWSDPGD